MTRSSGSCDGDPICGARPLFVVMRPADLGGGGARPVRDRHFERGARADTKPGATEGHVRAIAGANMVA